MHSVRILSLASAACFAFIPACAPSGQKKITSESSPRSTRTHSTDPNFLKDRPHTERQALSTQLAEKGEQLQRKGAKRFDQPQEALDFFIEQRFPVGQSVMPTEHLRAQLDGIKLRENMAQRNGPMLPQWTEIGPGNIGGRTRAIVIDPVDPAVMYGGGVAGGVWKSTNGGGSWAVADDLMLNMAVTSLAMDPFDSSVIYAGTGEGIFNGDAVRGLGIFKSVDAGQTWNQLAATSNSAFYYVNKVGISPADSTRLYACTQYGVYRSLDAGVSWTAVLRNPWYVAGAPASNGNGVGCIDLLLRSDTAPNPDVILASFGSFDPDGLFRSTDGGDTWTQLGSPADLLVARQGRMSLAIAPSDNSVMYVSMADNGNTGNPTGTMVNVFRSLDGGDTWSVRLNFGNYISPWLLSNLVYGAGCAGTVNYAQGWYDNTIAVDPADPNIVWVGGVDLFRSNDGGQNFGIASYWWFFRTDANYVHADHHVLAFHPGYNGTTNQILFSGSDGGIARTNNARGGTSNEDCPTFFLPSISWVQLNNSYGTIQFYHGDSARTEDTFAGGCQDNGTLRVNSASTPNNWDEIAGGDGGYFAIDPGNPLVMYAEYQGFPQILKSTDGGNSFSGAVVGITDTDGLFISPFAMDQASPTTLWTGGSRPWRTTSGAASWSLAGTALTTGKISAIAIAPGDSNVVYLGYTGGQVARSTNALAPSPSWSLFTSANGLNSAYLSSLAVDPLDSDIVYCTYSTFGVPHVLRSADGGFDWVSIDGISFSGIPDIPVHSLAIRPGISGQLFAGTELGVFMSNDTGESWVPVNQGLSHTVVEALDFQSTDALVAFTHGRGAFRTILEDVDCNTNEIPDGDELPGNDCNNNLVLDLCEPAYSDCNESGVLDSCELGGEPAFDQGFDTASTLVPGGWAIINRSSPVGPNTWFQGNPSAFPAFQGASNSYIGVNYESTGSVGTISNWLLTPTLALVPTANLSFYTRTTSGSSWPDRLEVRLSTAGSSTDVGFSATSVGVFTTLLASVNPTLQVGGYPDAWTKFEIPLSVLGAPASGRIAFRYFVTNGGTNGDNSNYIGIDSLRLVNQNADTNGNGVLDVCEAPAAPQLAVGESEKNRFASFLIPTGGPVGDTAVRVELTSLHHPAGPPNAPNFTAFEGQYRYLNAIRDGANNPVYVCPDSPGSGTSFACAKLGCAPEYRDWAGIFGGAVVHVTGDGVVPSSQYTVTQLAASCIGNETSCTAISAELVVTTERWGNVDGSPVGGAPAALDIGRVVDKVRDLPGAFTKSRCQLREGTPNPYAFAVNAQDIARIVDAVKGQPYPFTISACP